MRAHSVRQLTICKRCNNLGNKPEMINLPSGKIMHGECAYIELGIDGIVKLPHEEIMKFTIAQIGMKTMKQVVTEIFKRV